MLVFNTLESSGETLRNALSLINYENGFIVTSFKASFYKVFMEVVASKNFKTAESLHLNFFILKKEDAMKIKVEMPNNLKVKRLEKEHVDFVDDYWIGKYEGSKLFLERLVKMGHSLGVFDENGGLVAWVLR